MVLTQIQSEVFFYQPVNTNKSNFVSFLVFVGAAASFTAKISFFETVAKREVILWSRPKTVNIQGYSKLREPTRTRENCFPLIWWILKKLKDIYSSARLVLSQSVLFIKLFNWQCFGYHFFMILSQVQWRIIFLPTSKHRQASYNLPSTIFCDIFAAYIFWCGYFMVNNPDNNGALVNVNVNLNVNVAIEMTNIHVLFT